MKKSAICIALAAATLAGCSNTEKEAQARLDRAKAMYEQNELFSAKSEIDSIRTLYPKEFGVLKEGLALMRLVELKEMERNITYCDSIMPIKLVEAEELKKGFTFEKDTVYEEIGNYIWKQQTIERNVKRCYVRCGVNEKGEMYLASVYFGGRPINHTGIKLSMKDGSFAETATVPYDGGTNYRFKDLGNITEVVTYKGDNGLDAIKFIYTNEKERIKIDYTGDKPYVMVMANGDKKAIAATYNLSTVLSDIERISLEKEKAIKKQTYLKGKLEP
ncbi:MAG: hypothetical protein RR382_09015 [Tannerellaceae bacterium]